MGVAGAASGGGLKTSATKDGVFAEFGFDGEEGALEILVFGVFGLREETGLFGRGGVSDMAQRDVEAVELVGAEAMVEFEGTGGDELRGIGGVVEVDAAVELFAGG